MMVTAFDVETGRCLGSFSGRPTDVAAQSRGRTEVLVAGVFSSDLFHMVDGQVEKRPALVMRGKTSILADDVDCARMSGIPVGTDVHICWMDAPLRSSERHVISSVIDDGSLAWSTAVAGRFQITLLPPWPWQQLQFEVMANAAA